MAESGNFDMETRPDQNISNMSGDIALPRDNGELVFAAPWEGRAFGIAVALSELGRYEWKEFSDRLAQEIAGSNKDDTESPYYERWLASLEQIAIEKGYITASELASKVKVIQEEDSTSHEHK